MPSGQGWNPEQNHLRHLARRTVCHPPGRRGLFFTRSVDLYLVHDGIIAMVMPHSALQAGQYSKWRTGKWQARAGGESLEADFSYKRAWDLERLEPNTFFPSHHPWSSPNGPA